MKCRFVYVDDGVERLVGFTREELFGKSFLDFIDEPDRAHFSRILEHRNHFESNFDITSIHILSRDGHRIPAEVVVSLNFIAGNPVNFQIIIDSGCTGDTVTRTTVSRPDYRHFIDRLLSATPDSYAADALDALYEYLGDDHCLIYQVSGEQIEPLHWRSKAPETGIAVAQVPQGLLAWVAMSDESYAGLDPDSARRAVEKCGYAPTEYIQKLRLGTDAFLVRVLLDEIWESAEQRSAVDGVKQALALTERLAISHHLDAGTMTADGTSVLNELKTSLASAMKIAALLGSEKTEQK